MDHTGRHPAIDSHHGHTGSDLSEQGCRGSGDFNCRARTLGHSRLNESGPILDSWIPVSDNFDVHLFTETMRPPSRGFLDAVLYKNLNAAPEISFEDKIPYDHRDILARIHLQMDTISLETCLW